MLPIEIEGWNTEMQPPAGWDEKKDGVCHTIKASVQPDPHNAGRHYVVTGWKPSEKDLESIKNGGAIYLQCWGGMPPVALYTIDENGESNYEPLIKEPS